MCFALVRLNDHLSLLHSWAVLHVVLHVRHHRQHILIRLAVTDRVAISNIVPRVLGVLVLRGRYGAAAHVGRVSAAVVALALRCKYGADLLLHRAHCCLRWYCSVPVVYADALHLLIHSILSHLPHFLRLVEDLSLKDLLVLFHSLLLRIWHLAPVMVVVQLLVDRAAHGDLVLEVVFYIATAFDASPVCSIMVVRPTLVRVLDR